MFIEKAIVKNQNELPGDYWALELSAPKIAWSMKPGQFVHLRIPLLESSALRRPFGVFKATQNHVEILYCRVGRGTQAMTRLSPGQQVDLLGPLGNGFPEPEKISVPVLIAGGYGIAALYLLAERSPVKGIIFIGGATASDILFVDDFQKLGFEVRIATQDGSRGAHGLVTGILDEWLNNKSNDINPEFFACGPTAMLQAVTIRAKTNGRPAWLSLDRRMCCGVGACLACVQKVYKHPPDKHTVVSRSSPEKIGPDDWKWIRVCTEGPIFECRQIIWDKENDK